jgi:TatD DNase family protein
MRIVDTHTHLYMPQLAGDLDAVLGRAQAAGVDRMVCVGVDARSSRQCAELARAHPDRVLAAVGIHPNDLAEAAPDDMDGVSALASLPEVVAIGETGLDFHYDRTPSGEQVVGLRRHIELARRAGKPIIIHARKADERVLEILSEFGGPIRGVRHCFDASPPVAEAYLKAGLHISFGGAITRPGHKKLKAAAAAVPADRLLVETDCPYQSPARYAGQRNEPAYVVEVVRALAALRGTTAEEVAALTTANAEALFFGA